MDQHLRFQLQLTYRSKPIHFKYDGKRFVNTDNTVKLCAGHVYDISLTSNKPVLLRPNATQLRVYEDVESEPEKMEFTEASKDATRSILLTGWKCSLPITKDNNRVYIWIDTAVEEYGKLSFPLVVKVYHPDDKSSEHGFALRHIQYDFRKDAFQKDNTQLLTINVFKY